MPWTGVGSAAIGALGSLAGGFMSMSNAGSGGETDWNLWRANYEAQKEFAQNGIRWRVDDAKAAGLHPLAALGSSSAMYSPTASYTAGSAGQDYSWLGDVGQNIGRAIDAGLTKDERMKQQAYRDQDMQLNLENKQLQNDMLKHELVSQIAKDAIASNQAVTTQQQGPAMPSLRVRKDGTVLGQVMPGQSESTTSPVFTNKPAELIMNQPGTPQIEAGSHPEVKFGRTGDGGLAPYISTALEESMEDDMVGRFGWNLRNRVLPFISSLTGGLTGAEYPPSKDLLPEGASDWRYDYVRGAYYPFFPKKRNNHGLTRF